MTRLRTWFDQLEEEAALLLRGRTAPTRGPDPDLRASPLHEIGERYQPSKRSHDYLRHYWTHLRDIRGSARRVVEIGVETDRSLRMWEEFFPKAEILGIDIDPSCKSFEGGRRRIFIGDQMDPAFLHAFVSQSGGDFDVVMDDGLHSEEAILTSFSVLFPALAPRGIYAVEDIIRLPGVVRFFGELMNHVNYFPDDGRAWPSVDAFSPDTPWLTRNVTGVSFYRYLCFVQRGFNPEENPYLLDPSVYKRDQEAKRQRVRDAYDEMLGRGEEPSREALRRAFDNRLTSHIDRVLEERKPPLFLQCARSKLARLRQLGRRR